MRGNRSFGGSVLAFALVGALAVSSAASAQVRPDYRTASPRSLVQAWRSAPREDRGAIADAMITRRAQVLPALWDSARFGDREEKMFACSMIAEMRDRDGVDAVLAATADGDVKVRRRAATALRILNDGRAAPRLRELARTEGDTGVLKTALAALGRLGNRGDVALIKPFLSHGDPGVRVVAGGALAMLGNESGLDLVLQATSSSDPGVQKSATYALGLFASPLAAQRLQAIVDDPQGAWKAYALVGLAERRVASQSNSQRVQTLEALARGRSRTLAEWAVDRLTDIGNADAAAALQNVVSKKTPVGPMAQRRLRVLGVVP